MYKNKRIIILGAGGHARVLIEALKDYRLDIIGLIDVNLEKGTEICGIPVIGDDEEIAKHSKDDVYLVNGIGSIPGNNHRFKLANDLRNKGYHFLTVVHPSAIIATGAELGDGVQIMAGCVLQSNVSIGQDSIINTGVIIDHDCQIGKNCHLAPGVTLSGGVQVESLVHIGAGSTIIENKKIGAGSVIAAASVVYSDISKNVKYIQKRKEYSYYIENNNIA
jgi:UDP-perosamine 4-acetyltransferase